MKILITGAAGFIGSNLMEHLIKLGHNCIGIDNFNNLVYSNKIKQENIKSFKNKVLNIDILDFEKISNLLKENDFDVVIHLAAHAGVRNSFLNKQEYLRNNITGLYSLLRNLRKTKCRNFIFASSSSVYGNCYKPEFLETETLLKPISPYAQTKLLGEDILKIYHDYFDFSISCLRFFTVYGPRQRPDLAIHKFTNLILNNKIIDVYGDGTNVRDYTYVEDIVGGIIGAIDYTCNKNIYEIFNLGGGNPISLLGMISILGKKLKRVPKLNFTEMQKGDVIKTISNCNKAKNLLNYQVKTSFEEGIDKFLEWKIQS